MACGVSLSEIASDVAERSGYPISPNAIWKWETDQRSPQGEAGALYGEIIQALEGVLGS
jgi:intein-encoded DNA endonuclease-like protein